MRYHGKGMRSALAYEASIGHTIALKYVDAIYQVHSDPGIITDSQSFRTMQTQPSIP